MQHERNFLEHLTSGKLDLGIAPREALHSCGVAAQTLYRSMHAYVVRKDHPLANLYRQTGRVSQEEARAYASLRISTSLDDASWLEDDQSTDETAVTIPYMLAAPGLLSTSDLKLLVPGKLALDFIRTGELSAIPYEGKQNRFERSLYWHRSTESDPGLQWIRAMIVTHGTKLTDESALELLFGDTPRRNAPSQ